MTLYDTVVKAFKEYDKDLEKRAQSIIGETESERGKKLIQIAEKIAIEERNNNPIFIEAENLYRSTSNIKNEVNNFKRWLISYPDFYTIPRRKLDSLCEKNNWMIREFDDFVPTEEELDYILDIPHESGAKIKVVDHRPVNRRRPPKLTWFQKLFTEPQPEQDLQPEDTSRVVVRFLREGAYQLLNEQRNEDTKPV